MLQLFLALIIQGYSEAPFWRVKEKVYSRIENREIIVSVKTAASSAKVGKANLLTVTGGGQIHTPCDFAFLAAQNYAELAQESGYVEEHSWQEKEQILSLKVGAFGYHERATLKMKAEKPEAGPAIIHYEIVSGRVAGFKGQFVFYPLDPKAKKAHEMCDIGSAGEFSFDQLPIPKLFVTFGLEVMFQRMAARLRTFVERKHRGGQT